MKLTVELSDDDTSAVVRQELMSAIRMNLNPPYYPGDPNFALIDAMKTVLEYYSVPDDPELVKFLAQTGIMEIQARAYLNGEYPA